MRADTKPRPTEPPCSLVTFLPALNNPTPAFSGVPRTLRDHVGKREFGDFGTVLLAERPTSADLSDRVARWRAAETRDNLPLRSHSDQTAEDRRFNCLFVTTPLAIMIWILIGLLVAWLRGVI